MTPKSHLLAPYLGVLAAILALTSWIVANTLAAQADVAAEALSTLLRSRQEHERFAQLLNSIGVVQNLVQHSITSDARKTLPSYQQPAVLTYDAVGGSMFALKTTRLEIDRLALILESKDLNENARVDLNTTIRALSELLDQVNQVEERLGQRLAALHQLFRKSSGEHRSDGKDNGAKYWENVEEAYQQAGRKLYPLLLRRNSLSLQLKALEERTIAQLTDTAKRYSSRARNAKVASYIIFVLSSVLAILGKAIEQRQKRAADGIDG